MLAIKGQTERLVMDDFIARQGFHFECGCRVTFFFELGSDDLIRVSLSRPCSEQHVREFLLNAAAPPQVAWAGVAVSVSGRADRRYNQQTPQTVDCLMRDFDRAHAERWREKCRTT